MTKSRSNATAPNAKGTLVVGSGTDASSTLAVGSANQVLTVDSSTATGLKWASASGAAFAGCSIYSSTNPSIANATETKIACDTEFFDTDGYHSNTTNNTRITVPSGKAGKYYVTAYSLFATNSTGRRQFAIWRNNYSGSPAQICFQRVVGNGTCEAGAVLSGVVDLAVGDYLEFVVYQNSGGNLTAYMGGNDGCFSVYYLGA